MASSSGTSSRQVASIAAPLLVLTILSGGPSVSGGSADAADPDGFTYAAARHCSNVLNERDGERTAAGRAASIDVIAWHRGIADPDAANREAVAGAIEWLRDETVRTRDALAELEVAEPDQAALWSEYLDTFDGGIVELDRRAEFARTLTDELAPSPGGTVGDMERRGELLAELGLLGRDCETILGDLGPLPAHRQFVAATASTCTTIVSRRLAGGYVDNTIQMFEAVIAAREGEVQHSDELEAVLVALIGEWEHTVADLAAVPTDDVPDATAWAGVLDAANDAAAVPAMRLEALRSGDAEQVASAFQPTNAGLWFPSELMLDLRDCRMAALR